MVLIRQVGVPLAKALDPTLIEVGRESQREEAGNGCPSHRSYVAQIYSQRALTS